MVKNVKFDNSGGDNDEMVKRSSFYKKSTIGVINYLIYNTKAAFTQLKKAFSKPLIFCYFDPEYHIYVIINIFDYVFCGILSQLTLNSIG